MALKPRFIRFTRFTAWVSGVSIVIGSSCTEPVVDEESASACSNGVDDDQDGQPDCADEGCRTSSACEFTPDACANGIDDDRDGKTDCESASCVEAGHCAPFVTDCALAPQAGCPFGMACVVNRDQQRECRLPGVTPFGDDCSFPLDDGPAPCVVGDDCFNLCTHFCNTDLDCPRESVCITAPSVVDFGFCSVPCDVLLNPGSGGCKNNDLACVSGHMVNESYDESGAIWLCLPASAHDDASAALDAPCDDPPTVESPSDRVCPANLACVPDVEGDTRCRALCNKSDDGATVFGCPAQQDCVLFHSYDDRPAVPFDVARLGACIDR